MKKTKAEMQAEVEALMEAVGTDTAQVCAGLARDKFKAEKRMRELEIQLSESRSERRADQDTQLILDRLRKFVQGVVIGHLGKNHLSAITNIEDGTVTDLATLLDTFARR
jgi:hypothetical protein